MKTSVSSIVIVLILVLLAIGYVFYTTNPSQDDINTEVNQLSGTNSVVNPAILNDPTAQSLTGLRIYGTRPVDPPTNSLSRSNPFQGL